MSLKYNVLWIDDNKEDFKKQERLLYKYIESLFFLPKIDFCKDVSSAKDFIESEKYDVIFSDYNINEETGSDFITSIRNKSVNTEVLFYSAQSQLPKENFDRVTFASVTGAHWEERLLKKMKDLISLTVEKLNDLTQLRGLVMAEVSELDVIMKNLVAFYCNGSEENEKELREYIIGKVEERLKNALEMPDCDRKCYHKWKNSKIPEIIFEQNFDSYTTARALNHIFEKKPELRIKNFLKDYNDEIILNRNWLAHCQTTKNENGVEILITNKGDKEFSSEDISNIRKNIIKYHDVFESVKERI